MDEREQIKAQIALLKRDSTADAKVSVLLAQLDALDKWDYVASSRGMRKVRWSFWPENVYEGYTDGTRWNGWLNVWVTPETHAKVTADYTEGPDDDGDAFPTEPDESGLYSYAYGYTAVEEK